MKPSITIGLPFFNNEKTLSTAIKSILLQTYEDWELILINDGSVDGSLDIAKQFVDKDGRIRLISDGVNLGLVTRLNQIIDLANGLFIARMDADDIMLPNKLCKQVLAFNNNPNLDIIATAAYIIDDDDNPSGVRDTNPINELSKRAVLKCSLLIHPTILCKTEWCLRNKYDVNFHRAEDYELWCRTFKHTKFARISEPLFLYREGNVSVANYVASMSTLRKIIRIYGVNTYSYLELQLEMMKTYIKSFIYRGVGFLNLQYLLAKKRNMRLDIHEINKIKEVINSIKNS